MNEIKVLGTEQIDGTSFVGIEGGFGEGKRSMLARDIADATGTTTKKLNQNIERNRKRFTDGIDVIDLRDDSVVTHSDLKNMGFNQQAINRSSNIYLLSERGYSKLLKIMDSDEAWEQYDKFVDGYFQYREVAKQVKPMTTQEQIALIAQGTGELSKQIEEIDSRVTELDGNQVLSSARYEYISKSVNRKVRDYIQMQGLDHDTYVGELRRDLSRQILDVSGVRIRRDLRDKHFDAVVELIENWTPSTATIYKIKQTSLEV